MEFKACNGDPLPNNETLVVQAVYAPELYV